METLKENLWKGTETEPLAKGRTGDAVIAPKNAPQAVVVKDLDPPQFFNMHR